MKRDSHSREVTQTVESLIEHGSAYNVEELDRIYHENLKIIKIDELGEVTTADRADTMALFRSKREKKADPLSRKAEFNYVDASEDTGHVIVTREMQIGDRPEKSVFSLHLVREAGHWQVIHETAFVQPTENTH